MTQDTTVSYFVRYRGLPLPIDPFVTHYQERHARILQELPGIHGLALHVPATWHDPAGIHHDGTDFLAEMRFDSVAALEAALQSEARQRARTDFARLPKGAAAVTHQAMHRLQIF